MVFDSNDFLSQASDQEAYAAEVRLLERTFAQLIAYSVRIGCSNNAKHQPGTQYGSYPAQVEQHNQQQGYPHIDFSSPQIATPQGQHSYPTIQTEPSTNFQWFPETVEQVQSLDAGSLETLFAQLESAVPDRFPDQSYTSQINVAGKLINFYVERHLPKAQRGSNGVGEIGSEPCSFSYSFRSPLW